MVVLMRKFMAFVYAGVKESDTGLSKPSQWDLTADKEILEKESVLLVSRCTKIINAGLENAMYMINLKPVSAAALCVRAHS